MIDIDAIPDEPGTYQLVLWLGSPATLAVGRLGVFTFPAGRYLYTGSALGGLRARIARHLREQKRLRWHIDYLLQSARVEEVRVYPGRQRLECVLNQQVLQSGEGWVVVQGFGSSDCRCPAHLLYLG